MQIILTLVFFSIAGRRLRRSEKWNGNFLGTLVGEKGRVFVF